MAERCFAQLHAFKGLRTSCERRVDVHLGLMQLACALICYRRLPAVLSEFSTLRVRRGHIP